MNSSDHTAHATVPALDDIACDQHRDITATVQAECQQLQALEDAIAYRRARVTAPCPDCTADGHMCDDHACDLDLLAAYQRTAIAILNASNLRCGPPLIAHVLTRLHAPGPEDVMDKHAEEGGENRMDTECGGAAWIRAEANLVEAVILLRAHPQWAIWLPASGSDWTAIRPASSRSPAPELPTIWVHADTADELARLMRAADEQISGRG
jgi:hypothetical protein